jgi:quercetin dioxygenase-like cupin family protein
MSSTKPYILHQGDRVPDEDDDVKASAASTNNSFTLIESHTAGGAPPHLHEREDEAMYVLDGEISVTFEGRTQRAGARSFVFLPRGVPHAWDVTSGTATVLILTAPAGIERFLREFHEPDADRTRVGAKHGIRFFPNA